MGSSSSTALKQAERQLLSDMARVTKSDMTTEMADRKSLAEEVVRLHSLLDQQNKETERLKDELKSELDKQCEETARLKRHIEQQESLDQEKTRRQEYLQTLESKLRVCADSKAVKLNVGGRVFHTSVTTLTSKPSMLSLLVGGGSFPCNDKGEYFIDRCPTYFPLILEYLRTDSVACNLTQLCPRDALGLYKELDFYQLEELANELAWATPSLMHLRKPGTWDRSQLREGSVLESVHENVWSIYKVLAVSMDGSQLLVDNRSCHGWVPRTSEEIVPLGTRVLSKARLAEYLSQEHTCSFCSASFTPYMRAQTSC